MSIHTISNAAVALVLVLLTGSIAFGRQPSQSPPEAVTSIDAVVNNRMTELGLVGVGAAIVVDKRVVWMKGYGFADKANRVPFTPETVMNVGSISKTITGVALMRAVQDGKLSLDEDVNRYLPFKVVHPSFPDARITLRQLATHTSGISDRWEVYETTYHYGGDAPEPLGEFLKAYFVPGGKYYSKENFVDAAPGTKREYSNIGAGLAGYIVELAVGERLNTYTRRLIFEPLAMRNAGWFLNEIPAANHARLYAAQGGITFPIPLYGITTYPDGGVRTSVADLSRLFVTLLNDGELDGARILDRKTAVEMLRFQFTDTNKPANVALNEKNTGIFWQSKYNVTRMGHGGTDPGVRTEMLCDLKREIGVVLFTNTSICDHDQKLLNALYEDLWKFAVSLKARNRL